MDQGHRTCLGSVLLLSVILLLACQAALAEAVIPTQFRTLRRNVARILGVSESQVNVKGKTHEKVDAVGEGRAVEVHAVVVMER